MSHALELALLSCALLGLRHGFDYDHLAAITDITSIQRGWRDGMRLGILYALGHALTVAVLGLAVIVLRLSLPAGMDIVGERLVGATLIALSLYVLVAWLRHRRDPQREYDPLRERDPQTENGPQLQHSQLQDVQLRNGRQPQNNQRPHHIPQAHHAQHIHLAQHTHPIPRSRIALLVSGARYTAWRLRRLRNPTLPRPDPFRFDYSNSSVFLVGIIHGLGAETPSQLLLFLLAANLGGTSRGVLGLVCFILGLLAMNTLMTASAGGVFASGAHRPRLQSIATSITVVYSFIIGTIFLFGISDKLPALVR